MSVSEAMAAIKAGRLPAAEALLRQVIAAAPSNAAALNLLAVVLMSLERFAEAEPFMAKAVALNPYSDVSFYNYGLICKRLGKPERAIEYFSHALALKANVAETWNNRGACFNDLLQHEYAIRDFDKAISINPSYAGAHANKAKALTLLKRYDDAGRAYELALGFKPDLFEAWFGLGRLLEDRKRWRDAVAAYDRAFALKPHSDGVEGARLHAKTTLCDWTGFAAERAHLIVTVKTGLPGSDPFRFLPLTDAPDDHLRCARIWAETNHPAAAGVSLLARTSDDKIRLGYVSSDFNEHAMAALLAELFELHDKSRFRTTAFSIGHDDGSELRARIARAFDEFVDCRTLSDEQTAQAVADHEIDLLVDLNGFTKGARTGVFARRPAPIQVNYLGYPGTMGAPYYNYIIGDATTFGGADPAHYAEKLVTLPHCYQPNDRQRVISERPFRFDDLGLPSGGFVFCCFNNPYKILPATFDSWMRILKQVEGGVLWLLVDSSTARANLRMEAEARGVDPARIVFAERMGQADHLARHRFADLFLDTLPYNAHTTASDALWAGLPVLTLMGKAFAGRVAASLLNAVGLSSWLVTHSAEEYEAVAVDLAKNRDLLAEIRSKLVKGRTALPLFDTPSYARHLEAAFEAMHRRHQQGLAPDHIEIEKA